MANIRTYWKLLAVLLLGLTLFSFLVEYSCVHVYKTSVHNLIRKTTATFLLRMTNGGDDGTPDYYTPNNDSTVVANHSDIKRVIQYYRCHEQMCKCPLEVNLAPVYMCRNSSMQPTYITLFTTMTYRPQKLVAFNRALDLWPSLGLEVKPLLFLAPSNDFPGPIDWFFTQLAEVAEPACERGWDVLVAPHCNAYNYPVLASMFRVAQRVVNATWYGYANADILFTETLLHTLHFLQKQNATPVDFVVGKRTNIVVSKMLSISKGLLQCTVYMCMFTVSKW